MQEITRDPIGMGQERMCFVHPEDPRLAIKIPRTGTSKRSQVETSFYRQLSKLGAITGKHIPRFHGTCDTNRGQGIVVDLVRNYDGEISQSMNWYLAHGYPIEEFEDCLEELKQFLLQHLIICDRDLKMKNLLVQKTSASRVRLVIISGLIENPASGWRGLFAFLTRRKIERHWNEFVEAIYFSREVLLQRETMSQNT